ncbi:MAG: eukaryotic-like serine/threonine-protein kinase [Solirubrobacteraceae bacterium]|nr:eukaryotic-like serine/threonine-protein kinase [Solirubrobacteraceae bacterium]
MMAGQLLASRYELGDRLGVGGMSTVQLAFDRRLERHVAVKLLAEHLAEDQLFVSRFRREALAAARLVHPNIVQVFDFGLDEGTGRHYIVMEYIRGQSGAEILRERGRLPVDEALEIVTQSCRGLDYAHRNGVVHRDVKPGNLLRSDDDVVKLADFGIAKAVSDESSITQIGSVLGTASYLAPEQARGEEAGPQADLYALGVVTYQLLSGRLPYEAASLTELALKQQREAPAWLHELDPAIPEPLAVAIDRALALDPAERPSTAEEFRIALEEGARGIGVDATSATRVVPGDPADTAATRVAAVPAPAPVTRPEVAPRVPRQPRGPRTGAQAPVPAGRRTPPPAGRPKRRKGGIRRFFTLLLVALLLAAGALIAVVATSANQKSVQLRKVTGDQVQTIVQQVKDLVDANTQ